MIRPVEDAVVEYGCPIFLITDHGCQFGRQFSRRLKQLEIRHVRGRVRSPQFNGKVERLFRTLRRWWRPTLKAFSIRGIQIALDAFRH
jgi:transposase InsO family protein